MQRTSTMKSQRCGCSTLCLSMILLVILLHTMPVSAQRFMRQGFSNQEDFGAEMALDDKEAAVDMTREMFLMQDMQWQLQPISDLHGITDRKVRRHIQKYLGKPVDLKLYKKRGKYGLRAIGRMENGNKLRAFWRQAAPSTTSSSTRKASDFLQVPYEDAVRSRLFTVEFEVQLPPLSKKKQKGGGALPSVIYQVSVEPGSMNAKALVPRGSGRVSVLPKGRGGEKVQDAGSANVGVVNMKPGLVDPTWARWRPPVFRKGRDSGLM